jgi:hypothetical protein
MHVLLAYNGNNAGPTSNFDLTALSDPDFSQRNGHYIFTEDYGIGYLFAQSLNMSDARLQAPTFSALNSDGFRITGFQKKAGLGGTPTLADRFVNYPVMMPKFEEIQAQASTTVAQQQWLLMSLLTSNWSKQIPQGPMIVMEGTTTAFTPTVNTWSGGQNISLTSNPRGGVYAVVRATCQFAADILAFRLIFPRAPMYRGRKLRPGWVAQNAVGDFDDAITQYDPFHLGVWGYFHTFELPQLEVLASTSAALTPIVRLWCVYLGGDLSLLNQVIGQNTVS